MDGAAIRKGLRKVRQDRKVTLRVLHEKTGISPSTINRIERVEKYPTHKPDLETLIALLAAMGLTLSAFFAQIEGLKTDDGGATDLAPPRRAHHGGDVSAALARTADSVVQREFLTALVAEFVGAIDRLVATRAEDRRAPRAKPTTRRRTGTAR